MTCTELIEYCKAPAASVPYGFRWVDWLTGGETILTSTWEVEAGLTNVSEASDDTTTGITLSGGTIGESYLVRNIITTTTMSDERAFRVKISYRGD